MESCSYYGIPYPPDFLGLVNVIAETSAINVGAAFISGTAVGSLYYFFKGALCVSPMYSSSSTSITSIIQSRFVGGLAMARSNAPNVGGRVALFTILVTAIGAQLAIFRGNKDRFAPFRPTSQFVAATVSTAAITAAGRRPRTALGYGLLWGSLWYIPFAGTAHSEMITSRTRPPVTHVYPKPNQKVATWLSQSN